MNTWIRARGNDRIRTARGVQPRPSAPPNPPRLTRSDGKEQLKTKNKATNPQMPAEPQREQQSNGLKAFATRSPLLFALTFFAVSFCLSVVGFFALPAFWGTQVVQSVLAIGVLAGLGWLRPAGFNGPSQWRSLHLLWLPGLWALFILFSFSFTIHVPGAMMVVPIALFALLNGLREEALFRGVILQALLPYGWLRAAALSALFFGLFHLLNLLSYPFWLVLVQVFSTFLFGFGFAACRLRANTIWPLILFHACTDLFPISTALNGGTVPAIYSSLWYVITGTVFNLALAGYGLFLLRHRRPAPHLGNAVRAVAGMRLTAGS